MNIFSRMNQLVDLTTSEKILVNFMKENYNDFLQMTIDDLCKACYISKPTVYRLCKKLELPGFSELKLHVTRDYKDFVNETELDYDFPIKFNETQQDVISNIKSVYEQTVASSYNLMDLDQLRLAAEALKKAKQIDIYTSAGNIYFAENFKFQMLELNALVNVPLEEYHQHLTASCSDEGHVAIVISFGARGHSIKKIVSILKERKTPIILISSPEENELQKYSKIQLYMSPYENHYHKISSFSTRLSLLYILDCLYSCYFKLDYDKNLKEKVDIYRRMGNIE